MIAEPAIVRLNATIANMSRSTRVLSAVTDFSNSPTRYLRVPPLDSDSLTQIDLASTMMSKTIRISHNQNCITSSPKRECGFDVHRSYTRAAHEPYSIFYRPG